MKWFCMAISYLFVIQMNQMQCFMPNRASAILDTDITVEDIIRSGIYKAFDQNNNIAGDTVEETFEDLLKYDAFTNGKNNDVISEEVLAEIIHIANIAAIEHHGNPAWTFSDENIIEGHWLLASLRDRLLAVINVSKADIEQKQKDTNTIESSHQTEESTNVLSQSINYFNETKMKKLESAEKTKGHVNEQEPNYMAAREILGHIFYLITNFYRNTNWVEFNGTSIYKELGLSSKPIVSGIGDDVMAAPSPSGINKASGSPGYSSHYYLHKDAAMLAVRHITAYLTDKEFGIRAIIGQGKFSDMFRGTDEHTTSIIVNINDGLASKELMNCLREQNMTVMKNDSQNACVNEDTTVVEIRDVESNYEDWQHFECENQRLRVFYIVRRESSEQSGSRKKRATALNGMDFYHLIADVSGGTVYETDKSNIGAVVDIIKESVKAKPPIPVLKLRLDYSANDFYIPVDDLAFNVTIKIQSVASYLPRLNLYRPDGTREDFRNTTVATDQKLGTKLQVIKLFNPQHGLWRIERQSTSTIDVDVGANTDLDFFYKFMQPGPDGFGLYPLTGRPISGDNTTIQVTVPLVDKVSSVESLLFLDRNNGVLKNETLRNVGGRRGKSLFITEVEIPPKEFMVAIEGRDIEGNIFRRLNSKLVSSLAIQLEVFPTSGSLYVNKTITIAYRVRNVGGGTTSIEVSISDDKSFAQSPTTNTHSVTSSVNGTFTLKAGSVKGETTTVTIAAKASGAPNNKVQYYVRRFTVEEKIVRVIDVTPPTCNVTSIQGKCDFGTDVCMCSQHWWEVSAVVGDTGDGMYMVFANGAGNTSNTTTEKFQPGHKGFINTTLRIDCCHQHVKMTAVDVAGNVGFCDVTISSGNFTPPNPDQCKPHTAEQTTSLYESTTVSESSDTSASSGVSVAVIAGATAGSVAVVASVTVLAIYLKSRMTANAVVPLNGNTKFKMPT